MDRGDCQDASRRASEISTLATLLDHEEIIRRGQAFAEGPKQHRSDVLKRVIEQAFSELRLDAAFSEAAAQG